MIPTLYGRAGDTLYLHGSTASRMLRELATGVPACVTVTIICGLVLARSAFHHSMNYRSVVDNAPGTLRPEDHFGSHYFGALGGGTRPARGRVACDNRAGIPYYRKALPKLGLSVWNPQELNHHYPTMGFFWGGLYRMTGRMFSAAALIAICLGSIAVQPLTGARDQNQALIELEKRWLEAEDDPSALESILADDFVHVLPFGFVTKAEQLRYMRSHPSTQARPARHLVDLKVRIYGNAGIVNGIVVSSTREGKAQKTIFTDVFACRDGKWQAVNAQELPLNESTHP